MATMGAERHSPWAAVYVTYPPTATLRGGGANGAIDRGCVKTLVGLES